MVNNAENRLAAAGIELPPAPPPFGPYVPAVQTGNLLFLTGMLPTVGHEAKFLGRAGKELNAEQGRSAAYAAALNVLAVARQHLGSLDKISRVVKLGSILRQPAISPIMWPLPMPPRNFSATSSERTRCRRAWCSEWRAFRSACRSSWKRSLRSPPDACLLDSEPAHREAWD